jgi:DeoR family transcriptional regulator, glycerol-3-phosphate regulon repressor
MVRPLAVRRHNEIVQRLRAAGSVSVGELANVFGVSHETIRRDLKLLADNGHLDVVHGGAARRGMIEPSIAQRGEENAEGKGAIAREAARMVADGASVLIDSGTTTAALTYELVGRPGLTIFTNSLNHALTLCRVSGNRVVMLGGEIDSNDEAAFGTGTSTGIDAVRVDIAFIGVGGFAEDGGMTDYSITAAETRGKMILAGRAYLLADQTKFARRTPFRVPNMDKCAGVIVDTMPEGPLASAWKAYGWDIVLAK